MSKPIISIRYWKDQPTVQLPEELKDKVEVRFVDAFEEESLLLDHNGVKVYRTIKDDMGDSVMYSEYWVATEIGADWESEQAFDLRDLPNIRDSESAKYKQMFPDDTNKQSLAHAIDKGLVTEDGLE